MNPLYENPTREEAIEIMLQNINFTNKCEMVKLEESLGRISAQDILAVYDLPNVPCSRWDGIAFNFNHWNENGKDKSNWQLNRDYIYANTGIPLEKTYDTMVMMEDITLEGNGVKISDSDKIHKGQNIIEVGEKISKGAVVVEINTKICPSHLNIMAGGGISYVPVYVKPRLGILATGDELTPLQGYIPLGKNVESNSFSQAAKSGMKGAMPYVYPILPDNKEILKNAIKKAVNENDMVIIGGGTAKGQSDFTREVLSDLGQVFFFNVNHGPGHCTSFTLIDGKPVMGLVGPPGGSELTFDFYVLPVLDFFLNQKTVIRKVRTTLEKNLSPHFKVDFYFSLCSYKYKGSYYSTPLPHSKIDQSIADYNSILYVPKDHMGYLKGDIVEVELRPFTEDL